MPKQANRDIFLWGGLTAGVAGLGYLASQRTPEPFQSSDALYYSGFKFYGSLANFKKGWETPLTIPLTGGTTHTQPALNMFFGTKVPILFILLFLSFGEAIPNAYLNIKVCILDVSANTIVYDMLKSFNSKEDLTNLTSEEVFMAGIPEFPNTTEEKHYILYFNIFSPESNNINTSEICYTTPETDTTTLVNPKSKDYMFSILKRYTADIPEAYKNKCVKPRPDLNLEGVRLPLSVREKLEKLTFQYSVEVLKAGLSNPQTPGEYLDMYKEQTISVSTSTPTSSISYAPFFSFLIGLANLNTFVKFEGNVYAKPSADFKLDAPAVTRALPTKAGFQDYRRDASVEGFASTSTSDIGTLYNYKGEELYSKPPTTIPMWVWYAVGGGVVLLLILGMLMSSRGSSRNYYYAPPPPQYGNRVAYANSYR